MSKKVNIDLLEDMAPEMFILLKRILATEIEDYKWCVEEYRKETNGCPKCRAKYAAHELIKYIESE
ncbi:MAG: hypothetical protein WC738_07410 [Candidatus Omnitrophota bacterium]|jgi:hypothetical protein